MSYRVVQHLRNNAVGYVALFVALGGVSYAATSLPKNSVGSKQLKKGAVKRSELARGAVTGPKVAAGSLTGKQIKASTLGQVPSAAHAGSADTATNAARAGSADSAAHARVADLLGGSAPSDFFAASKVRTFNVKLAFGEAQTLFSVGTLTFSAKCVENEANPVDWPVRTSPSCSSRRARTARSSPTDRMVACSEGRRRLSRHRHDRGRPRGCLAQRRHGNLARRHREQRSRLWDARRRSQRRRGVRG